MRDEPSAARWLQPTTDRQGASRAWKVMAQRDEGAGLTALPGPGAELTAAKAACG
jgi:hypothetical protein